MRTLTDYKPKETEAVLASFTLNILDPGIERVVSASSIDSALRDNLLHEIRVRLGLRRNDNSPEAQRKINRLLVEEIRRASLSKEKIRQARARIGSRGDLPPDLYEIVLGNAFDHDGYLRAIPRFLIEESMKKPDAVQHLVPEEFGSNTDRRYSLYLKAAKHHLVSEQFYLLTTSMREGYTQTALGTFVLFPSEMKLSNTSPVEALRKFTNLYGFEIEIGPKKGKFFLYEEVPITKDQPTGLVQSKEVASNDFISGVLVKSNPEKGIVEIAMAYMIDLAKYRESMIKRGFRVR